MEPDQVRRTCLELWLLPVHLVPPSQHSHQTTHLEQAPCQAPPHSRVHLARLQLRPLLVKARPEDRLGGQPQVRLLSPAQLLLHPHHLLLEIQPLELTLPPHSPADPLYLDKDHQVHRHSRWGAALRRRLSPQVHRHLLQLVHPRPHFLSLVIKVLLQPLEEATLHHLEIYHRQLLHHHFRKVH